MSRILVVDDSSTMRKLLGHILTPAGHQVVEAEDGIRALEQLAEQGVDLMIVDLNMPQMNGIELIQAIRKEPKFTDLPIIMLTTQADDESRRRCLSAGANLFLVKPVPKDMVLFKVQSLLGSK